MVRWAGDSNHDANAAPRPVSLTPSLSSRLPPRLSATHAPTSLPTSLSRGCSLPKCRMGLKDMLDAQQGQLGGMMGGAEELDDFDDGEL